MPVLQCIRKPLMSIENASEEVARNIVLERFRGDYTSIENLMTRVSIPKDYAESLAQSGALDSIAGDSRRALWEVGVVHRRLEAQHSPEHTLFDMPLVQRADIPTLDELSASERLAWDYKAHSAGRIHPVTLFRRMLNDLEVRTIETCYRHVMPDFGTKIPDMRITIGGIVVLRQAPSTAKGVMFVTLGDETGFIQTIVMPTIREKFRKFLRLPALIVRGKLEGVNNWRGLLVEEVWELKNVSGGYSGFASATGGQDEQVIWHSERNPDFTTLN
jgi:DNA polymerase III alpha subunit